jgi:hypothetical protein
MESGDEAGNEKAGDRLAVGLRLHRGRSSSGSRIIGTGAGAVKKR